MALSVLSTAHKLEKYSLLFPVLLPVIGEIHREGVGPDNLQLHTTMGADDHSALAGLVHTDDRITIGTARLGHVLSLSCCLASLLCPASPFDQVLS
jgi:hypothetical protein